MRIVAFWISVDVSCKDAILGMEGEHRSDTFDILTWRFEGTCSTASLSEGSTKQRRHTRRNDRQRPFLGHSDKDNHVLQFLQGYTIYKCSRNDIHSQHALDLQMSGCKFEQVPVYKSSWILPVSARSDNDSLPRDGRSPAGGGRKHAFTERVEGSPPSVWHKRR